MNKDWVAGMEYAKRKRKEMRMTELKKWLKLFSYLIGGTIFCGGSLWAYIMMIQLVGSP